MTTTDPTPLAEQIAREHLALLNTSTWLIVGCTCDPTLTAPPSGVAGSWYAAHIAAVAERAVADRLEALARELDELTITHQAENYATVLRIKREGVMEAIRRVEGETP